MAFDETLAERIRRGLTRHRNIEEKKMFGGLGFLLRGNILVGVWKNSLIVRVGPDGYDDALLEPDVREFDITGRPLKGWVMVGPRAAGDDEVLDAWIQRALEFVRTLPSK